MENKIKIYLAGDSTVSSYKNMEAPQTGWGQVLYQQFAGADCCKSYHPDWTEFGQVMCYQLPDIEIINCAMAGRSSRSFREEGRLAEIDGLIKQGDYLFVQFAHNDANREKTERYVPVGLYADSLEEYRKICKKHHAVLVLITAIAMRDIDHYGENGVEGFPISFPEYRTEMMRYALDKNEILLDLGYATSSYLNTLDIEETKSVYLWAEKGKYQGKYQDGVSDNAHLSEYGAKKYAAILAGLIKNKDVKELKPVRELLK